MGNAISRRIKSTLKICQRDILGVTALKRSTKGAMIAPFVMHAIQSRTTLQAKVLRK